MAQKITTKEILEIIRFFLKKVYCLPPKPRQRGSQKIIFY